MSHGIDDTSPETWAVLLRLYRQMSPDERLERMAGLNRTTRLAALAGIRARHPGISDREAALRCSALWLGPDLARVGRKFSDDWHIAHYWNPRDVGPDSIMPSFPWLFEPVKENETPKINEDGKALIRFSE